MKETLVEIMNQCKTDNIELLKIIKKLTEEKLAGGLGIIDVIIVAQCLKQISQKR